MRQYYLNMAGIRWEIRSPLELRTDEKFQPFLSEPLQPDIVLEYRMGRPVITGPLIWDHAPQVYRDDNGFWVERFLAVRTKPSGCVYLDRNNPFFVRGWIYPDRVDDLSSLESLLDISELEILLSLFGGIGLHSSFIRWQDRAMLFTAPSGTGKSTQAELWQQFRDADIINGDRSMIRNVNGEWTAFGSPFAGSSSIYRNESVPIRAIVVLRQHLKNQIRRLEAGEAFRYLYSEMVIPKWNSKAHQEIITQTELLAYQIPVFLLQCTPDENAVRTLEKYLIDNHIGLSSAIE